MLSLAEKSVQGQSQGKGWGCMDSPSELPPGLEGRLQAEQRSEDYKVRGCLAGLINIEPWDGCPLSNSYEPGILLGRANKTSTGPADTELTVPQTKPVLRDKKESIKVLTQGVIQFRWNLKDIYLVQSEG